MHHCHIVEVHVEHTLLYSSDFRSVKLDVYASENMEETAIHVLPKSLINRLKSCMKRFAR